MSQKFDKIFPQIGNVFTTQLLPAATDHKRNKGGVSEGDCAVYVWRFEFYFRKNEPWKDFRLTSYYS